MRPSWKIRRRVIWATLVFCAAVIGWLAVAGPDTELNRTIANALIFLGGAVISSYVFGAAWDDMNVMRHLGGQAYRDLVPPGPSAGPTSHHDPKAGWP